MTATSGFVLNHFYAGMLVFILSVVIASLFVQSPTWRVALGFAGVLISLWVPIHARSIFEWAVSIADQPSPTGLLLLAVLIVSLVAGHHIERASEFRFGTSVIALAGIVLYPSSIGFIDYDVYAIGYGGYLLPIAIALILAYAIYRGFFLVALALNVGIGLFLLGVGQSRNLWDYVIDPTAWIFATLVWIGVAAGFLGKRSAAKLAQPSSGIGETPISH